MNRKKMVFVVVAAMLGLYALHVSANFLLYRLKACNQPCRWLGGTPGYGSCTPLDAHLEVRTTPDPASRSVAVWYRATVTNRSCETLQIPAEFFMYNQRPTAGVSVVVRDANGRELAKEHGSTARGAGEIAKDIQPYGQDVTALDPFIRTIDKERTALVERRVYSVLDVPPGISIVASPMTLWPHRMVIKELVTPDYMGSAFAPEAVDIPEAAKRFALPPDGFRRLEGYDLKYEGAYTAEFLFDGYAGLQHHLRWESYPKWTQSFLWFLARGKRPFGSNRGHVEVKASSGKIPFEVKR